MVVWKQGGISLFSTGCARTRGWGFSVQHPCLVMFTHLNGCGKVLLHLAMTQTRVTDLLCLTVAMLQLEINYIISFYLIYCLLRIIDEMASCLSIQLHYIIHALHRNYKRPSCNTHRQYRGIYHRTLDDSAGSEIWDSKAIF